MGMPSSKYSSEEVTVSEEGVQSQSVFLRQDGIDYKKLSVILRVNVSLPDGWTIYTHKYNTMVLEVLSPPPNITVVRDEGGLLVTWAQPSVRLRCANKCFEYQLDISGQDELKTVIKQLNYTEPNADPKLSYRVRMRTRKNNDCRGSYHWSDWSQFVTVPSSEPAYKLNSVVIILISLGIPMILLALLLFFRLQRVSELLFPPIPRPSKKYKNFLEKTDTFLFSPPVQPPKYEEEITEVEETQ
ncbi:granulocyte-macrophage colony-stimulating factor receptor subunit alpha-like [Myripristis murdjan]|uniref:granulocyte-macrophage colony-stimulating factor receptor subunit alpha-like n=1 Tax=Myripristis murdjan TaxID=586833 RepID=UPI001175FEEA|nr:granulocyte-macrophage colony-stimulating factor receptor subunit alpha-like [Myripristis murdjan]XP_029930842.1 granulocyte-macrophage colony-stimulating factor receptor subunit alpha-like [Myripristis murdjan]